MLLLNKKLRSVRPPLSLIAPLTYRIILGFIVFNIWIGYVIWSQQSMAINIMGSIFGKEFWALVFIVLSVWLYIGIRLNDWRQVRWAMIASLLVKTIWTYALIVLAFQVGFQSVQGVLGLWLLATYVQLVTVVYFVPNGKTHA